MVVGCTFLMTCASHSLLMQVPHASLFPPIPPPSLPSFSFFLLSAFSCDSRSLSARRRISNDCKSCNKEARSREKASRPPSCRIRGKRPECRASPTRNSLEDVECGKTEGWAPIFAICTERRNLCPRLLMIYWGPAGTFMEKAGGSM